MRTPLIVAVVLLIHMLGVWLIIAWDPVVIKPTMPRSEERVMVMLGPRSAEPLAQQPQQLPASAPSAPEKKTLKLSPQPKKIQSPIAAIDIAPAPATPVIAAQPETMRSDIPRADDMMSMIEAARKRRAESAAAQNIETQNDNSIARANVATSIRQVQGAGQDGDGGIFQMRYIGSRDAEFFFRGWSKNSNRNSSRVIKVEQGEYVDIQTAVVQKMIEIIREQNNETFIWDSRRLDKKISLSARKEHTLDLQGFLLREFFENYVQPARR